MKMNIEFTASVQGVTVESVTFLLADGRTIYPWWDECSHHYFHEDGQMEAWIRKTAYDGHYQNLTLNNLRGAKITEIQVAAEDDAPIDHFEITKISFASYGTEIALEDISCDSILKSWRIPVEWVVKNAAQIQICAKTYEEAVQMIDSEERKRLYNRKSEVISYSVDGVERPVADKEAQSAVTD